VKHWQVPLAVNHDLMIIMRRQSSAFARSILSHLCTQLVTGWTSTGPV
jgi:hypothetical protein